MQIVEVIWDDAYSGGDTTTEKAQKAKPYRTHSVGYLIGESAEGVTIVMDTYPSKPKKGAESGFIPWGVIVKYSSITFNA